MTGFFIQGAMVFSAFVFGGLAMCCGMVSQEKRGAGDSKAETTADIVGVVAVIACISLAYFAGRVA